jgi:HSP20 family protein
MRNDCCIATTAPDRTEVTRRAALPPLDVRESADEVRVDVDVPGAGKEDVELRLDEGFLEIRARVPAREMTPERYHVREHGPRELVRRLRLSDTIDAAGVTAEVARGVLTVRLPKTAAAKPRRIEIR